MRILPMGPHAVLVEELDVDPAAFSLGLRALAVDGVIDVVPAARTVLVRCRSAVALERAVARLGEVRPVAVGDATRSIVEIPTTYDGDDLDEVAERSGLTVEQVIERHRGAVYEVAFCGFAPGFGYLRGLPPELHLPRRATPRTSVPAGSIAIAAEFSAVYPRATPGGWHLVGRTSLTMFDPGRQPPARLQPGARVRFVGG